MRNIEISTHVFALIWSHRRPGEETEDAILERVLSERGLAEDTSHVGEGPVQGGEVPAEEVPNFYDRGPRTWSQPTWATDLAEVLLARGGKARLSQIYADVEKLRRKEGRSTPKSIGATVRRTLENHSSDSHNYTGGADLFCMPEGKGAGIWALRPQSD